MKTKGQISTHRITDLMYFSNILIANKHAVSLKLRQIP